MPKKNQPTKPTNLPPVLRHIGRPRKWTDPEQILSLADEYFDQCVNGGEPITITGTCAAIGTTRQQLLDYLGEGRHAEGNGGDSASIRDAIKHIKARCEQYAERHMFTARNPAGGIFALKNYGWKDTQTVETVGFVEHRADPETLAILADFLASLNGRRLPAPADVIDVQETRQAIPVTRPTVDNPVETVDNSNASILTEANHE